MKTIRAISLAAAALGLLTLGACKSKDTGYTPQPQPDPGTYYSGK